jgi:hypothetical protein
MDPLLVLSLVEACAGLAVAAGKLAIGLKSLADNYKSAAFTFRSLSNQCKLFATAVRAIQAWMEEAPDTSNVDDRIWEQLGDSLECANDAIYALENELVSTSNGTVNTFWEKVNVIWNMEGLKELQDCIHKQITGLGVILQIMNLPTRQCQTDGLAEQSSVFQESRSSAMSVRNPETSTIRGGTDAASTIHAASTIMTSLSQMPHFDFEEMLLTSQGYLRNRNKTLALHLTSSKAGKVQDAGTSVSAWDLPVKSSNDIDLTKGADKARTGSKEDLIDFMDNYVLARHEVLHTKYSKVKRYYFEKDAQVTALRNDIEKLRAQDPNQRAGVALSHAPELARVKMEYETLKREFEDYRRKHVIEMRNTLQGADRAKAADFERRQLLDVIEKQKQEHQKLQKQMDWYRIQLSYWNETSSNSSGTSRTVPRHILPLLDNGSR